MAANGKTLLATTLSPRVLQSAPVSPPSAVQKSQRMNTLWQSPDDATAVLVLAHGAGAGERDRLVLDVLVRQLEPLAVAVDEQGVAELMVSLNRDFSPPLSSDVLHRWHRMILKGPSGFREIGGYRESDEPMQIISGAAYAPRVHFEAPPSNRVAAEMARLDRNMKLLRLTREVSPIPGKGQCNSCVRA